MHNITSVNDLFAIEPKDVENMMKLWNQDLPNAALKLRKGVQKKVQVWVSWAADRRRRRNLPIDMVSWAAPGVIQEAMQVMAISENWLSIILMPVLHSFPMLIRESLFPMPS
jgi:hypothetical protein